MAKAKKAKKKVARKVVRKPARKAAPRAVKAPKWKMAGAQELITNLTVRDAAAALEFYKNALGAKELIRHPAPDGKAIWHAELKIGDTVLALNDEIMPGPVTAAGPNHKATASFFLYVPDCDALYHRAVAAGAHASMPLTDMFWGDRVGAVADPFGQVWSFATHKKDMTFDEQKKAGEEFARQMAAQHGPSTASQ